MSCFINKNKKNKYFKGKEILSGDSLELAKYLCCIFKISN